MGVSGWSWEREGKLGDWNWSLEKSFVNLERDFPKWYREVVLVTVRSKSCICRFGPFEGGVTTDVFRVLNKVVKFPSVFDVFLVCQY